jgi:large subunit ribosomal protein L15
MLQHELKPAPGSRRPAKRIGRGNASGHGTYATKGLKGQKARTGNDLRIGFEGGQMMLTARLARKRGFTNKWRLEYEWVNVGQLSKASAGGSVTAESLAAAGIISRPELPLKVLGDGEIGQALTVSAHAFTESARKKIEAAGGRVDQLPGHALDRAHRIAAEAKDEEASKAEVASEKPETKGDEPSEPEAAPKQAEDEEGA